MVYVPNPFSPFEHAEADSDFPKSEQEQTAVKKAMGG